MKYFIKTFGCQQNVADSEKVAAFYRTQGMVEADNYYDADYVIINTCMVRQSAENRIYGLINNLKKSRIKNQTISGQKIILTGCMMGMAHRDKTGKYLGQLRKRLPLVDKFIPIEKLLSAQQPIRQDKINAWVAISNGCNNFCTYCVVPFSRGREVSRPYQDIIHDCQNLKKRGYYTVTLLGQNVNSYGSDLLAIKHAVGVASRVSPREADFRNDRKSPAGEKYHQKQNLLHNHPIYVKHLGRYRIPTLFPHLLEEVAKMGFETVNFISSNPWDFSDKLIDVIARNKNISRTIHLPVQSGDDHVLKRMNRWYKASEYLALISKLKSQISKVKFTTDIIVGFCGETEKEFKNTIKLCKKVGFEKAYIAMYSPRPMTIAAKLFKDDVFYKIKKERRQILENLINKPHLKKFNRIR